MFGNLISGFSSPSRSSHVSRQTLQLNELCINNLNFSQSLFEHQFIHLVVFSLLAPSKCLAENGMSVPFRLCKQVSISRPLAHTSNRFLFGFAEAGKQAGVNKTWQNKQSAMRPARNIRDTAVLKRANGKFPEYPNLPWKCSNYFHLQHWHTWTHTPTAAEKISIKTNCNKFYSTHETNVFSLWLSLEQIIKCVIKRSWDVGTRYLATEAPASLSDGKKYIIIVYVYVWCLLKICWLLLNIRYR